VDINEKYKSLNEQIGKPDPSNEKAKRCLPSEVPYNETNSTQDPDTSSSPPAVITPCGVQERGALEHTREAAINFALSQLGERLSQRKNVTRWEKKQPRNAKPKRATIDPNLPHFDKSVNCDVPVGMNPLSYPSPLSSLPIQ
jgi:hypothetical protein